MPRDRDCTKVSADLGPLLFREFEMWREKKGIPRAEALRHAVARVIEGMDPDAFAQAEMPGVAPRKPGQLHLRVIPKPVDNCDPGRSLSANPGANAKAIAGQEPVDADSRTTEEKQLEEFLQSPVTHALLSAWRCSRCSIPVDPKWTHCPVCGNDQMKKRDIGDFPSFDEVVERWRSARELERR